MLKETHMTEQSVSMKNFFQFPEKPIPREDGEKWKERPTTKGQNTILLVPCIICWTA